jgi:tetratricopeptide (TPR) repeat protein
MEIQEEEGSDEEPPAAKAAAPKAASPAAAPSPKAAAPATQAKSSPKAPPAPEPQKFAPPARLPSDVESTPEGVEAAKAKGNACFQQGDLEGAVRWFSGALAHATKLGLRDLQAVLHSNRALVYSKQADWAKVNADCTSAIDLGGKTTVKAQYRRAQARFELEELSGALQDVNAVLASYGDATNAEAEALKQRILAAVQDKKAKMQKERLEATVVTRKGPVAIPETSPKTPYEVARQFSALKRYPDQLAEYVRLRVPPTVLRSVFKKNMIEADLMERFLEVLTRPGFFPSATCRDYCDAILETQSGDTQLMMLSDSEKNAIRAAVVGTSPRPTDARLRKAGLLE